MNMKSFLNRFMSKKSTSAAIAKERLQIIVSHERSQKQSPDFLPRLQRELVAVIAKYVHVDPNQVKVDLGGDEHCSILELNITLPNLAELAEQTSHS